MRKMFGSTKPIGARLRHEAGHGGPFASPKPGSPRLAPSHSPGLHHRAGSHGWRRRPSDEGRRAASPLCQRRGGGPRGVGDRPRSARPRRRPRIRHRRCRKVLNMRLFSNSKTGKAWDLSVKQSNFGVLLVSQFTLYGILKGNKPDFHVAMPPQKAKTFYESLVEKFRKSYTSDAVKDGVFGAMMKVNLVNDGPVTMQLDSSVLCSGSSEVVEDGEQ
ncbi:uncharacterized protein LOC135584432 isoform X1 [Musa acuminata AAA Group]|uniref:uncharacterized protein LOC135584432 isoform X1 n=1 Tax=Musa acuminata AAA Group TaxID=214697 RepID=UPI0031E18BF7